VRGPRLRDTFPVGWSLGALLALVLGYISAPPVTDATGRTHYLDLLRLTVVLAGLALLVLWRWKYVRWQPKNPERWPSAAFRTAPGTFVKVRSRGTKHHGFETSYDLHGDTDLDIEGDDYEGPKTP
jgi:hypothetical protein